MPVRPVLIAALTGVVACTAAGLVLDTAGVEPAYAIIGSVLLGVTAMLGAALLLDYWLR